MGGEGRLEKLAGTGAHSYSTGDATGGSEEAAKFENAM
jgi:formate dehydrogenase